MRDVDGEFVFEDRGDGTTLATYALRLDPGLPLPGRVLNLLTEQVMQGSMEDLKQRVESSVERASERAHRPPPALLGRPLRRRPPAARDRGAASTARAGGPSACCPERGELALAARGGRRRGGRAPAGGAPARGCSRPGGLLGLRRRAAATTACAGRLARERARRARALQHLGGAGRAARSGVPHLMHVREIYAGAGPGAAVAAVAAAPAARRRPRLRLGRGGRAVRRQPEGVRAARRAAARPRARRPRDEARAALGLARRTLRGGAARARQRLEGPGRAGRGAAPSSADLDAMGLVAGDPWPGQERRAARARGGGGQAGRPAAAARLPRRRGHAARRRRRRGRPVQAPRPAAQLGPRGRGRRAARSWPPPTAG